MKKIKFFIPAILILLVPVFTQSMKPIEQKVKPAKMSVKEQNRTLNQIPIYLENIIQDLREQMNPSLEYISLQRGLVEVYLGVYMLWYKSYFSLEENTATNFKIIDHIGRLRNLLLGKIYSLEEDFVKELGRALKDKEQNEPKLDPELERNMEPEDAEKLKKQMKLEYEFEYKDLTNDFYQEFLKLQKEQTDIIDMFELVKHKIEILVEKQITKKGEQLDRPKIVLEMEPEIGKTSMKRRTPPALPKAGPRESLERQKALEQKALEQKKLEEQKRAQKDSEIMKKRAPARPKVGPKKSGKTLEPEKAEPSPRREQIGAKDKDKDKDKGKVEPVAVEIGSKKGQKRPAPSFEKKEQLGLEEPPKIEEMLEKQAKGTARELKRESKMELKEKEKDQPKELTGYDIPRINELRRRLEARQIEEENPEKAAAISRLLDMSNPDLLRLTNPQIEKAINPAYIEPGSVQSSFKPGILVIRERSLEEAGTDMRSLFNLVKKAFFGSRKREFEEEPKEKKEDKDVF